MYLVEISKSLSNIEGTKYTHLINHIRCPASAQPAFCFPMSAASNPSIPSGIKLSLHHACLWVSAQHSDDGWLPCDSELRTTSLCLFSGFSFTAMIMSSSQLCSLICSVVIISDICWAHQRKAPEVHPKNFQKTQVCLKSIISVLIKKNTRISSRLSLELKVEPAPSVMHPGCRKESHGGDLRLSCDCSPFQVTLWLPSSGV